MHNSGQFNIKRAIPCKYVLIQGTESSTAKGGNIVMLLEDDFPDKSCIPVHRKGQFDA